MTTVPLGPYRPAVVHCPVGDCNWTGRVPLLHRGGGQPLKACPTETAAALSAHRRDAHPGEPS